MPVTVPFALGVNFTPSSTLEVSPESAVAGVPKSKMVSSGVTAADGEEAGPVPLALVAVTVKVYAVPSVKPVTSVDVAEPDTCIGVCDVAPTHGVTVYELIGEPPGDGAVQYTRASLDAGFAPTPVGAPGGELDGVTALEGAEAAPLPNELLAVTVNVYVVPFVRFVIVAPLAGADTVVAGWATEPMYGVIV
jgi:hypothetical protein